MDKNMNAKEPDSFALKLIEIQYNAARFEVEHYLGKMYDVLKVALGVIPILSGALIALVADQGTWSAATERPILLGVFCLLSPMFVVVCIYIGNIGIAQYKALTRAADYIKIHFEDYIFQPIMAQLEKEKDAHIFRGANLSQFLFWENFLSQHGYDATDKRVRSNYDSDKHVMLAFLIFIAIALFVISTVCIAAFFALIWRSSILYYGVIGVAFENVVFEFVILTSGVLYLVTITWALISFRKFFSVITMTGALSPSIDGGVRKL